MPGGLLASRPGWCWGRSSHHPGLAVAVGSNVRSPVPGPPMAMFEHGGRRLLSGVDALDLGALAFLLGVIGIECGIVGGAVREQHPRMGKPSPKDAVDELELLAAGLEYH